MRRFSLWFVLVIIGGLLLLSRSASANKEVAAFTPAAQVYLPAIFSYLSPTPTSTATPTATSTSTPTATPLPVEGIFTMVEDKTTYATYIEWVKYYQAIHNLTGQPQNFGILGVNVEGPITMPFKTSWDGAGAPGGVLTINPGCWGPIDMNANPCAQSATAGRSEDHIGDDLLEHSPWEITTPGQYRLTMYICLSSFTECQQPGGIWRPLGQPQTITAIDWTPTPSIPRTVDPRIKPANLCRLITDDPRGIYLACPKVELKTKRSSAGR